MKNFIYGLGCFLTTGILHKIFDGYGGSGSKLDVTCSSFFILVGILLWVVISFVGWSERGEIRDLKSRLFNLREDYQQSLQEKIERKNVLKSQIRALKMQIPTPPSGDSVRIWLREDFKKLWVRSKEVTALSDRLVDIESEEVNEAGNHLKFPNPIPVFGPAELQQGDKIPPIFSKDTNPNLNKHFSARRSFIMSSSSWIEVLYGVYYLEHILIADDMLATYGLFYDFITGKLYAEQTTEQYYDDVVAISMTNEFRKIQLRVADLKKTHIQEAPTFVLSLASGENRAVTFVSEDYFLEIKNEIRVAEDDISRIYWIGRSRKDIDNAIKALRFQLRLHKGTVDL